MKSSPKAFQFPPSLGIFALTFALTLGTDGGVISAVQPKFDLRRRLHGPGHAGHCRAQFRAGQREHHPLRLLARAGSRLPVGERFSQLLLPALCLGAPYAAYIARLTRAGMLEVLNLDYIRTAYAKGLAAPTVIVKHALRGAMLPVVTYLGPATAGILTGSLVVERIFNLPGMGSHFIEAATQRDYTLAMGMVLVYTFLLYVMNSLVDLSYAIIDPRVKVE